MILARLTEIVPVYCVTCQGRQTQCRIKMAGTVFRLDFMGDVMLGRLIDQLMPTHVHEPEEERTVKYFLKSRPELGGYDAESPWGSMLPLLLESNLRFINLETSVTTSRLKWPNKVFNYRMHPANLKTLESAKINYAGLANNHSLDFSEEGLKDTVESLRQAGIAAAGAGLTREEAVRPAILPLHVSGEHRLDPKHTVCVWSGSDHPSDWKFVPEFHLIGYDSKTRKRLQTMISDPKIPESAPAPLKVFSVHWGPNYAWRPAAEMQSLAHFLIDECGVDIIHGHSSHHVQGVEIYKGKPIIYGCGDFVDDYALVADFRNDISALWRVHVEYDGDRLVPNVLEIFPTKCKSFRTHPITREDPDHEWFGAKLTALCKDFGTIVRPQVGGSGQFFIDIIHS